MQHLPEDNDFNRRHRFLDPDPNNSGRERATSQPPRANLTSLRNQNSPSSPSSSSSPWSPRIPQQPTRTLTTGLPMSVPTRSSSFSNPQSNYSSALRESHFESTFEDDESEALSDTYDHHDDELYLPTSSRGRSYAPDLTRSRSQSLATTTTRPTSIQSPYQHSHLWPDSANNSNPLNIPSARYGEIKPPASSRYGSLGAMGRSPLADNGYPNRNTIDVSNMSPFVRDVGQILLDDGSAFRELWAGMNPPKDENGGGGSGTTSRRHSVSVVQPRRPTIVGFNAPESPGDETHGHSRPGVFNAQPFGGRGGLMLSDDDLAADLGMLSMKEPGAPSSSSTASQPSSLPIYPRSPPSADRVSPYHLNIPSGTSFTSRQQFGSPSESALSTGASPPRGHFDQQILEAQYGQQQLTARFIPGQGIQYLPMQNNGAGFARQGPLSPTTTSRPIQPQQGPYYHQMQRRPSDASQTQQTPLSDLGKGLPLSSVPASWPLFIVEFKAGRTDLFYLTDLSQDIRVGDLVIVEADRGKDLGKVVNDSITLKEVEAFQREVREREAGEAMSPGGAAATGKKDINPKMIYGKAQANDTQHLVTKMQDEVKALQLCQSKVRQKKLPMEVIDAEYQWDRRKLTFYFIAEKRIDFRELVRELFRLYKTRIWMASLQGPGGYEQ
ncbi:PSP1 C-terminal conserved region-domain-containing protein [Suillus discolor]|uniref:PSP1 C-terminal conserved region-domain-containing protein n=1 Tax=Suillus discolor TaxID=1912936 RepID=A0A9P7EV45_9AGAM|nr:PSP1 C-terminal conserved region-domain-containing protein [Suillus discolor]KAG2090375.1 PSP1 C-terminal conserved region-domain-containing protein [Suillus discolor]